MQTVLSPRPDIRIYHTFRARVLGIAFINDCLVVCTDRGVYRQTKKGGCWRKVNPKHPKP